MRKTIRQYEAMSLPKIDFTTIWGEINSAKIDMLPYHKIASSLPDMTTESFGSLLDDFSSIQLPSVNPDLFCDYKLITIPETNQGSDIQQTPPEKLATTARKKNITNDSTDSQEINNKNLDFLTFLRARSNSFVIALKKADFEDGMMNDVADEVETYISQNKFATYLWLNSLYSQNQTDFEVVSGLLRIIGLTVDTSNADLLLPIVKCGLTDSHAEAQEAALMVIERWRTRECLEALKTVRFESKWIAKYAESISKELEEELQDVA